MPVFSLQELFEKLHIIGADAAHPEVAFPAAIVDYEDEFRGFSLMEHIYCRTQIHPG